MSLGVFLNQLASTGEVAVSSPDPLSPEEAGNCRAALVEMDQAARLEAPGTPPSLDMEAAAWAAGMLYRLCQFLAYRDIPAEAIAAAVEQPCPGPMSPAVAYSVDLVFAHLPDLLNLARGLAPGDPLVEGIRGLSRRWPLSSVGLADLGPVDVEGFIGDASLRQLYADRILARGDASRAVDPRVRAAIRCSLGLYGNLCPAVERAIIKEGQS